MIKEDEEAEEADNALSKKKKKEKTVTPLSRRTTSLGVQIEVLKPGSGNEAMVGKKLKVKYQGWLADNGQCFDQGVINFRLGLGEVIVGWDEGIKGMLKGEERRLLVPPRLGYGGEGSPPGIPPNARLVFQVELLDC